MIQAVYIAISFCKIILGVLIFYRIFPEKRWNGKGVLWLGGGVMVVLAAAQAWDSCHGFIPMIQIFINGILNAFIMKIFLRCEFQIALLWNWGYDIIYSLPKVPLMIIRGVWLEEDVEYVNVQGGRVWSETILCFLLVCVICFLYYRYLEQLTFLMKQMTKSIHRRTSLLVIEMVIIELLRTMLFMGIVRFIPEDIVTGIMTVVVTLIMFLVYVLYVYSKAEQINMELRHEQLAKENKIITQYCREDAKRLHDLKHILMYLQGCLEKGNYVCAQECIEEHLNEVKILQRHTWTGFAEIDLILDYKIQQMRQYEIQFSADIEIYSLPVKGEDFMIILGNLLDNSIEAAMECGATERRIHLFIKNVNEMFLMKIGNSCVKKLNENGIGRLRTTKKDRLLHGWGMENVREIVKMVGGEFRYVCNENWFEVEVSMLRKVGKKKL